MNTAVMRSDSHLDSVGAEINAVLIRLRLSSSVIPSEIEFSYKDF